VERRSLIILIVITAAAIAMALILVSVREGAPSDLAGGARPTTTTIATTTTRQATSAPDTTSSTAAPTTTAAATPPATLAPGATACDPYTTITETGTISSPDLVEASGLAASRTAPGVLWSHNDSRGGARTYAIGPDGSDLGSFDIAGALAFDWEDMAAGPGSDPATSMLYFGDIGDNFSIREGRVTVYRVPEPDPATITGTIDGSVALEFSYPDGVYNAEALFISDDSIFIVTKNREEARVYRGDVAGDGSSVEMLELVGVLPLGAEVTGADVSWDGSTIAFRGYSTVWMWHRTPGQSVAEALGTEPCTAPSPDEVQGESIAFLSDASYVTASEGKNPAMFAIPSDF